MCRLICNLPELSIRIFNPLASYCYLIGMNCGSQILILHAVEFFAALNNTCISDSTLLLWLIVPTGRTLPLWLSGNDMQQQDSISDRTLVLLFNVPADLQSAGIEYKDFQSACFLLLIYRYVFRIADPYILCCRIAYPTEQ